MITTILNLQNTIATATLGIDLDLRKLGIKYNPDKFSGGSKKFSETTVLFFINGKIVITGGKTIEKAQNGAQEAMAFVKTMGYHDAEVKNFKITNMVFSADLGFHLCLYKLTPCIYEPELFPGAKIKIPDSKAIILLFTSGKLIITGSNNLPEAQRAFQFIKPRLSRARVWKN